MIHNNSRTASSVRLNTDLSPVAEAPSISELDDFRPISPIKKQPPITLPPSDSEAPPVHIGVYNGKGTSTTPSLDLPRNQYETPRSSLLIDSNTTPPSLDRPGFRSDSPASLLGNGFRADSPSSFISYDKRISSQQSLLGRGTRASSTGSMMVPKTVSFGVKGVRSVSGASSINDYEGDGDAPQVPSKMHASELWTPWALTLPVLLGTIVAMSVFTVITALFIAMLQTKGGFDPSDSTSKLVWTYLPTLALVVLAIFWTQIEYWTKQLMPWKTMSNGSASARRTVLADYITPWHFIDSIAAGPRHGHWAVTFVVLNSLILKILIIVWSGPLLLVTSDNGNGDLTASFIIKAIPRHFTAACGPIFVILCIGLIFVRPARVVPRDVSSLAGLALIMASSNGLAHALHGRAGMPDKRFRRWATAANYSTVMVQETRNKSSFKIRMSASDEESAKGLMGNAEMGPPKTFWAPLPDIFRLLGPAVPPAILFVLEYLNQQSKQQSGLGDVVDSASQYQWSIWPGVVMLALFIEFGIFDFHVKVIQPYVQLREFRSASKRSIMLNYLSQFQPAAIRSAIFSWKRSHWSVIATSLVMILSPITIIAASGLFTPKILGANSAVFVQAQDQFSIARATAGNASRMASLAEAATHVGSSWPQWTYDNMVTPQIDFTIGQDVAEGSLSTVEATIPVILASINCSIVPAANVKFWDANSAATTSSAIVNGTTATNLTSVSDQGSNLNSTTATNLTALTGASNPVKRASNGLYYMALPVPKGCGAPCVTNDHIDTCSDNSTDYMFFGNISAAAGSTAFGRVLLTKPSPTPAGWSDSCPQVAAVYGQNIDHDNFASQATYLMCSPILYSAKADTTFSVPNWTVSAVNINDGSHTTFARGDAATIDLNAYLAKIPGLDAADIDPAFSAVISGKTAMPINSLSDLSRAQDVGIAMAKTYTRVLAQYVNLNMRQATNATSPSSHQKRQSLQQQQSIPATLTTPSRIRMVQNQTPTRIIQIIFAITFFLLLVPILLLDAKNLLPRNPCSIAAQAALLADSELIKRDLIPVGSEWLDDRQLRRTAMFEGLVFSLGLWERGGGGGIGRREKPGQETSMVFGVDVGNSERVY